MIEFAALPTTAGPVPAAPAGQSSASADPAGQAPENPGFADLLTIQQDRPAGALGNGAGAETHPTEPEAAAVGARALLQQLAVALQQGGKILPQGGNTGLPGALPAAAAPLTATILAQGLPDTAEETPELTDHLLETLAMANGPVPPTPEALATAGTVAAIPMSAAVPAQTAAPANGAAQSAAGTVPPALAGLPPLIDAQLNGRPLALAALPDLAPREPGSRQHTTPAERTIAVTRDAGIPATNFTITPDAPAARSGAVHLRPIVAGKTEPGTGAPVDMLAMLAEPQPSAAAMAPIASAAAGAAAPATTAATPTLTGHDFAALVDRLIEARNAATPQGIHVAMDHAEFGKVSLSFHQDAAGLSVSVASPDPAFARAVQAAAPAAGSDGMNGQTQSDARQFAAQNDQRQLSSGNFAQSNTGSQGRAPAEARTEGRVAGNPSADAQSAELPNAIPASRRGLFA